jgi:hypothetical protein
MNLLGEWIAISPNSTSSLPPKTGYYIVCCHLISKKDSIVTESFFNTELRRHASDIGDHNIMFALSRVGYKISHWMHKPPLPKL